MPLGGGDHVIEMSDRRELSPRRGRTPEVHRSPSPAPRSLTASNSNLHTSSGYHDDELLSRRRRDVSSDRNGGGDHMQPLLESGLGKPKPPIAGPEIDDLEGDERHPATADHHPGIDDGFFHPIDKHHDVPTLDDRFGDDGAHTTDPKHGDEGHHHQDDHGHDDDEADGPLHGNGGNYLLDVPHSAFGSMTSFGGRMTPRFRPDAPFPMTPEFAHPIPIDPRITPDVNVYQQKKNLAQGMMDLALLSANANQLRYVLEAGDFHPYYYPSLIFISASLILQIFVGIGLIVNSRYNVKEPDDICKADRINDLTVIGIFLITIVNVFIASFGVAQSPNMTPVHVEPVVPKI